MSAWRTAIMVISGCILGSTILFGWDRSSVEQDIPTPSQAKNIFLSQNKKTNLSKLKQSQLIASDNRSARDTYNEHDFVLMGCITSTDQSMALISINGAPAVVFSIGQKVVKEVTLHAVYEDKAILEHQKRLYELRLISIVTSPIDDITNIDSDPILAESTSPASPPDMFAVENQQELLNEIDDPALAESTSSALPPEMLTVENKQEFPNEIDDPALARPVME